MLDFLLKNWRLIVEFIFLVISLILFIFKKKPIKIVDSVKTLILDYLPDVINQVESYKDVFNPERKLSSSEKLTMALSMCETFLVDELGVPVSDLPLYRDHLVFHIEKILSTPHKKEVINNG